MKSKLIQVKKIYLCFNNEYNLNINFYTKDELLEDWNTWGEWADQPDGIGKRTRVCKNKGLNAKCRGKSVQIRKRVQIPEGIDDGKYLLL